LNLEFEIQEGRGCSTQRSERQLIVDSLQIEGKQGREQSRPFWFWGGESGQSTSLEFSK
jgi:hypothetical protein